MNPIDRLHLKGAVADSLRATHAYDVDCRTLANVCLILIRCVEAQDKEIKELREELEKCKMSP